ncbi:DUF605-domain-containing protein [Rhizoclosmatium globosum]|uniref:DUF605-domain-containing protein n=1 Tax=Rhizoclosmatium globosum TaxID=329046 RepID=A0A1Y2C3R6_9FUNG|nr:DUF605-domain-containing protein [Rhizoclosmatium globosum]|eukprot:ORY41693.1 DUF605-domain-containing protein [Rhizoclosmatium globosum]
MTAIPEPLKGITAFIQRADELVTRDPVVSYYCNFYAAKQAIEIGAKDNESQMYLLGLLDSLEAEKAKHAGNDALTNDVVGYAHVENFALKVFNSADNEDRAGKASKKTAKSFLAAATFLEVLKVFGPIDDSVAEKIKYGRFKAVDILKAIKEGRQPTAGPPGGDPLDQPSAPAPAPSSDPFTTPYVSPIQPFFDAQQPIQPTVLSAPSAPTPQPSPATQSVFPTIPTSFPSASAPPAASYNQPPPPASAPVHTPAPYYSAPPPSAPAPAPAPAPSRQPIPPLDFTITTAATKHCKFAISALQYDDVNTAVENLEKALALLRPYKK